MIIIQFLKYLFHDSFTEKDSLCSDTELIAILLNRCHLTIIQVDDLPMAAHQRFLLLLKVLRIYC